MNGLIRLATVADSNQILSIYAPYVANTTISFEIQVPTPEDFARRVEAISSQYPYLVYAIGDDIVAYAYASRHAERAAYCYSVDVSVYALPAVHGQGITHRLYACLFDILRTQGFFNAYAGYTVPNEKSRRFHEKCGFSPVGTYRNVGYKFDQWLDVVWMEKVLVPYVPKPAPVTYISQVPKETLDAMINLHNTQRHTII